MHDGCDTTRRDAGPEESSTKARIPLRRGLAMLGALTLLPCTAFASDAPERVARFSGQLHPLAVHFPIALLLGAAVLQILGGVRRWQGLREAARVLLFLGAVCAVVAATMGWFNAGFERPDDVSKTLQIHRWLGVAVAVLAVLASFLAARSRGPQSRRLTLPIIVLALLVSVTGHFGGMIVYGQDYLWDAFGAPKPRAAPAPAAGVKAASKPEKAPPKKDAPRGEAAVFNAPAVSQEVEDLLFASSDAEVLGIRRAIRLGMVPKPADPPPDTGQNASPSSQPRATNEIDQFLLASWKKAGLPEAANPPPLCDDATFLRRVYLDIIGVIPTIAEADRFLKSGDPDKRTKLIDELLARDRDYADHWTPFWEDALGSTSAQMQGGIPSRGNYRQWINDSFRENKAFDLFAAQLIDTSIPGAKKPETAEANGRKSRISYIRNETHTDTLQSAAAVAQVFLGTGMKCASCHSHFENDEWPQTRFLAFAGLFGPHDLEVIRCEKKSGNFVPARFAFDIPGAPVATPAEEAARLRRAAQLLTDPTNPRFAKAIVNRLWKRYLGLGLFEPVDDFRLSVAPAQPELLDWLAYDFMAHKYDLKHTIRLILTSRAYQARYDPALEDHFDVAKKTQPRYFRSPSLRRLTAEQVVDSLRVAAAQELDPAARLFRDDRSTPLTRSLGKPASRNEISTLRPDDVAVVQSLELLNGEEFAGLIYASPILGKAADSLGSADTQDQAIDLLCRALLSRPPRDEERKLAADFLKNAVPASTPPPRSEEVVLIDDDTPEGAKLGGDWLWVDGATANVSRGKRAHLQTAMGKPIQHYATWKDATAVGPADTLFVDVYLDPADPPKELMLQWNDGVMDHDWDHRVYWGEDLITFNHPATLVRHRMGDLPEAGKWVHLEVPASIAGFTGGPDSKIMGISFDQHGGTIAFDNSGVIKREVGPQYQALGDLLWALASSPEFHYIH